MPEHVVIKPVYYKGELFGYVANIAHMVEIGAWPSAASPRPQPRFTRRV